MSMFEEKNIAPMLIGADGDAFDDVNYLFEIKWDGERCIAYLDPKTGTELRNKRNVKMLPKVPELSEIHKQVTKRCILDGELMVLKDGKPDFFEIQRRSLMSNRFRIELAAKQYPATFIAYDILYLDGQDVTLLPLEQRKALLQKTVRQNERLAISKTIEGQGKALYRFAEQQQLEGIVAKRKDSVYIQGKRTKDWIKIKCMEDDDFIVCGYIKKDNHMTSLALGKYRNGELVYKGHVTLGVGGKPFQQIAELPRAIRAPFTDTPRGSEDAIWVAPMLVCTVEYMHKTQNGGMRQPVFKGLRMDKTPEECVEQ